MNSSGEIPSLEGRGYKDVLDRSYLASNDHAQQGMLMYPDKEWIAERTGTQGVSSSAWLPMRNAPGLKKLSMGWPRVPLIGSCDVTKLESVDVGSNAYTCRHACVDGG